jgi:hypothetical protein
MAYPTGSGSERLQRGTVESLSSDATALLFNGANGTALDQSSNVVPALHIITVLNISFTEMSAADEKINLYVQCTSPADSIYLINQQPLPLRGTFVYSEKIVLVGGDKLFVILSTTGNVDVHYSYIDQDWTTP